ncbi:Lipid A export ATP-binding/permease protein MsbA [Hartmannibacter diazotrophicus]|uniref:Lipid A export ATP-binding/permease protein MsbA n=1 Tax=Hartmannibacter diazotrophicus TaxID=1482074 RepID=A0A2C9D561_9HYPH|nr:ABC transporter ATP-binding protein [Hartmannibacter diazotrophicus]SON54645.1 Lipid A export ATP-binding/permease protein MsbA [Hartmannibacter diazotrophicus]
MAVAAGWQDGGTGQDGKEIVRRIVRRYLRPRWKLIAASILSMVLVAGTTGALPFLLQAAADQIFVGKDERLLWSLPVAIVIVMGLRAVVEYFGRILEARISNGVVAEIRKELFERLVGADLGFLQRSHSAAFVSVFSNDTQIVNNAAAQTLSALIKNALQAFALIIAMMWMDPKLGTLVLIALPVTVFLMSKQRRKMRSSVTRTLRGAGDLAALVSQTLTGIRVVKAYDQERAETLRASAVIDRTYEATMQTAQARAATGPVTEGLSGIGFAAAVFYGGWQGIYGTLTLGSFMGFMAAAMLVYQPLRQIATLQNALMEGMVAARRVFAILDEPRHIVDAPDARDLEVRGAHIRFEDVVFSYDGANPVISGVTVDIPAGHKVALVGPSGAGKSTFLNLVLRFYDPDRGRVLIDGQDLRQTKLASVRRASALLTQDPVLFDDTVASNIAYGSAAASEEDIAAAARAADAETFILELPGRYQSQVGEAGGQLSGGQKQRIAIARAMLRDAPILLLDEPTSALDAKAEARIQSSLETLFEGRTVLMIAHRLSTVKKADLILVFDHGRIVEKGTHDELVAAGGLYETLHRTQLSGAPEDEAAA